MGGADGRHWEGVLAPRNVSLAIAYERGFPLSMAIPRAMAFGADRHAYRRLSPNHWKMGIGAELCRAAAWGTAAEYETARGVFLACLAMEEAAWWTTEQCAGGSHDGYHAVGELLALIGALRAKDDELTRRLVDQVMRTLTVAMHTSTANGLCVCIGERPGPVLAHLSALGRISAGLPHQGALARDPGALVTDPYWTPERLATKLKHEGYLPRPTPDAPLPAMRRKLTVHRWADCIVTVMEADGDRPRAWARCQGALVQKWEEQPRGKPATGVLYDTTGTLSLPQIPREAKTVETPRRSAA